MRIDWRRDCWAGVEGKGVVGLLGDRWMVYLVQVGFVGLVIRVGLFLTVFYFENALIYLLLLLLLLLLPSVLFPFLDLLPLLPFPPLPDLFSLLLFPLLLALSLILTVYRLVVF